MIEKKLFLKKILKAIYWSLPFKRIIFIALKKVYLPSKEIYKHLRFGSYFRTEIEEKNYIKIYNSTIIENEIFWNGFAKTWEKESLKIWIKLAKNSKSILDIGANTGIYSLSAVGINKEAKVYAFEPVELYFNILKKNIILNKFYSSITPEQIAVANNNGICEIDDYSNEGKKLIVNSITIDEYLNKNNINYIDLIKIDVEKYEPFVFEGMQETIKKYKPTILVEILTNECADLIYKYVENYNYLFFNINENGGIRKVNKLSKSDYWNFLLCSEEVAKYLDLG